MSTGRLFHALGAAMENARSDETSLERGTTRSCLPAERVASWDVGYGSNQLDQIRRCTTIDSIVYQKALSFLTLYLQFAVLFAYVPISFSRTQGYPRFALLVLEPDDILGSLLEALTESAPHLFNMFIPCLFTIFILYYVNFFLFCVPIFQSSSKHLKSICRDRENFFLVTSWLRFLMLYFLRGLYAAFIRFSFILSCGSGRLQRLLL